MNLQVRCLVILGAIWLAKATQHAGPVPSENYLLHEVLDHNETYHVFWKFNASHITFEVHVQTRGYVGFGISPNGKMYPSDVVVGWVKDGVTHFTDRHTTGHVQPKTDQSQDWVLLHGEENDFGTMLKFERALVTCDDKDIDIVDDTMRMIFSYHPDDPKDEDNLQWHGATRRGARSMLLLSTSKQYTLPNDVQTRDLVHKNFHIPTKRTTYHCRIHSLADITTKHHMIKFEAVIQKDHDPFVHHMNVYKCRKPQKYVGREYECYDFKNNERDLMPCANVVAGWAVGSGPFYFPENIGLPIGENENAYVYILEVHYNNPGAVAGLIDNSGMRLTYTSHLRSLDAGVLSVGRKEDTNQIIPPYYSNFKSQSVCSEQCLSAALKDAHRDQINLFAVWQHAHLLGKEITTRHIRGDVELAPIAEDHHYDFDYQETRLFKKEVPLKKGGFSTSDEMCFSFIYYYPRIPIEMSYVEATYDTIPGHRTLDELVNIVEGYDWTSDVVREKFQADSNNSSMKELCILSGYRYLQRTFSPLEPRVPFQKPNSTSCI